MFNAFQCWNKTRPKNWLVEKQVKSSPITSPVLEWWLTCWAVCFFSSTSSWFSGGETHGLVELNGAWWEFWAERSATKAITDKAFPANGSDLMARSLISRFATFVPSFLRSERRDTWARCSLHTGWPQTTAAIRGKKLKRNSRILLSHADVGNGGSTT